jgi:hypothetical protein
MRQLLAFTGLSNPLLREIGKVIVGYASVEWRLSDMLYAVLSVGPKQGRLAVVEPRAPERLDLLGELAALRGVRLSSLLGIRTKPNLLKLRNEIEWCRAQRALIAHGLWAFDPDNLGQTYLRRVTGDWRPDQKDRQKVSRKIKPEAILYDTRKCRALRKRIDRLNKKLGDVKVRLEIALASPPPKSPSRSRARNRTRGHTVKARSQPQRPSSA